MDGRQRDRDEQTIMQQRHHQQNPGMQLTPQEVAVFKDCMREGFYARCVPISAMLATATYVACQKGILQKSPKYGALGKVSLALGVGYFFGKVSYYKVCYNRLLNVPGGAVARKHREMKEKGELGANPGFYIDPFQSMPAQAPVDSEAAPSLSLDLDAAPLGDADYTRSYSDDYTLQEDKLKDPLTLTYTPPTKTYEELRRHNRDQYESERNKSYSKYPTSPDRPPAQPIWDADTKPQKPKKKNKYGDEFEP